MLTKPFRCGRFAFMEPRTLVMGIVNITPDSFSGDGELLVHCALERGLKMIEAGADILDIGGQSARPGSEPISQEEELRRIMPVLELLSRYDCPVSVDTNKPFVMKRALEAGAAMINDIDGLTDPRSLEIVSEYDCGICIMHNSRLMLKPHGLGEKIVDDVASFFVSQQAACERAGLASDRILFDPGFGFGKDFGQNVCLFNRLSYFFQAEFPLLVGVSRKSMLGTLLNKQVEDRLLPSVVAAVLAAQLGARMLRVHDVPETVDALKVLTILAPVSLAI